MDKYLTLSGLQTFYTGLKTKFDSKVDKVDGKGLSTNDLTDELKAQYDLAERNTIITVKVNSETLVPDEDRVINITIPTGTLASLDEVAEENIAETLATKINGKADAATTLEGYGITNAYTKTETDALVGSAISGTYVVKGSSSFTSLPALTSEDLKAGYVYNVSDAFVTTTDFVEGAGISYPVGTNVVAVNAGTDDAPSMKWNALVGTYDLSIYTLAADIVAITDDEIDNILSGKNPDGTEIV